jgi:SAM-dependent methyltransferase
MSFQATGYGTDVPYVHVFTRELAPAWLDHVALVAGFAPPACEKGFAWCDLGCGQGFSAAVLAATHQAGRFCGIDAMPVHIDEARQFADECAIKNVDFHAADFAAATNMDFEGFDYIVAHGVYSWVDKEAQASLRRFIDRHLKPGGLVYVSYYAMPGRAADLPFQRLVRAIGLTLPGDSAAACASAVEIVNKFTALKAPALAASPMAVGLNEHPEKYKVAYLAHEFMAENWEPLCVTDVRAAMATIGLEPVGSAALVENYDSLVVGSAAREALASIGDDNARELARDFLIDQFFRRDVFTRGARRLDEDDRRKRLLASTFMLARPASMIEYVAKTPAGQVKFDNPAARAIVAELAAGPAALSDIAMRSGIAEQDILANALVLCAAETMLPVEGGRAAVADLNQAIRDRLGGANEIAYLVLPCGTAVKINDDIRGLLQSTPPSDAGDIAAWRDFLAAYGG